VGTVGNRIHPTALVGEGVELGDGNVIGPGAVLVGPLVIGDNTWIGPYVSIGTPAEYRGGPHPVGWDGELDGAGVVVGDGATIREFVTVNQGTERATVVGPDCYLLARSHVGHDCVLDAGVTLADAVQLGGHTHVWAWSNIGMGTVVHQRGLVGPGAMIGMGSAVRKTVPPFSVTVGNPARTVGVNTVGLSRRGCDEETVEAVSAYLAGKTAGQGDLPGKLPEDVADQLARWANVEA
jgi:UDP-N-acetylglucosamine acyltransferase